MNKAFRGAFLSGVIFPGLGHLTLKRYKRGIVLMLTVIAGFLVILAKAVQQSFRILEKIESQGGAMDMTGILNAATQASTASGSLIFYFALFLIIFCWIFGVVDAYRIGKKMDLEEESPGQGLNRKDDERPGA